MFADHIEPNCAMLCGELLFSGYALAEETRIIRPLPVGDYGPDRHGPCMISRPVFLKSTPFAWIVSSPTVGVRFEVY